MTFKVVIPARYASERLPGKPLRLLAGRPMIRHVYDRAVESGAEEVLVATDDERIAAACAGFAATAVMTGTSHVSGTERVAEVCALRGWGDDAVVVNVQGDEPLMPPAAIRQVADLLREPGAELATLAAPLDGIDDLMNPNVVKVVADAADVAMYFSRAPIPWVRDGATAGLSSQTRWQDARRHIGLYAYRVSALARLSSEPECALERLERLEQLRALWCGLAIRVADAVERPGPGVDTPHDLERVEALLLSGAVPGHSA